MKTVAAHEDVAGDRAGDAYWLGDAHLTIKARASLTGTAVMDMQLPPGSTAPLHVHHDLADNFFVIDGEIDVWCNGEITRAHAGAYISLPQGVPHSIRVTDTGPAHLLLVHANDRFVDFIEAVNARDTDETGPPPLAPDAVANAAREHGQDILGPAPFPLQPEQSAIGRGPAVNNAGTPEP